MPSRFDRIAFVASNAPAARKAHKALVAKYGDAALTDADVIVALGGDGLMLQTLHQFLGEAKPIYGMNRGSVGFLMNEFKENDLPDRLRQAERSVIHPLRMRAETVAGSIIEAFAINEVSMLRSSYQAAKLRVAVDDMPRLDPLICDGVLVATPAGSTAYNLSVNGPILPLDAPLLALTPISPFRPRRWRGAILPERARVSIDVLEADKRPVNAVADHTEVRAVRRVEVAMDRGIDLVMLHDPGHSLEERIVREQFSF